MLEYYRLLMADEARTSAFRRALASILRPDDVVLDLGCGTGILALFACSLGARKVIAIDKGHAADAAELLAAHLGFSDRMQVFHNESTRVTLEERATLLITETLGSLALDEAILGSVIDARRRLLQPVARIIPQAITVSFVPVESPETYDQHVTWWSAEPFGLDFSPLRTFAVNSVFGATFKPKSFLSSPADLIAVDLGTVDSNTVSGSATFIASRAGRLHGFGGWFTAALAPGIRLSTLEERTHWNHAFLPLETPIDVRAGARIFLDVESMSDGVAWGWRGSVEGAETVKFDQCSVFRSPPCKTHGR
jgi:hypothetical protein